MTHTSSLVIDCWKQDKFQVKVVKPDIFGFFTTNWKKTQITKDFSSLKYFDKEALLDVDWLETQFSKNIVAEPDYIVEEPTKQLLDWGSGIIGFIASESVLSTIMNTPFEKKKWKIRATTPRFSDQVYLHLEDNEDQDVKQCLKYNKLLKKQLFIKKPYRHYRKVSTVYDSRFHKVYKMNVGKYLVVYPYEIPGVLSDEEITSIQQLEKAEHIICDVIYNDELFKQHTSYNPLWWSKSELLQSKNFMIGILDRENNRLQEIKTFTTENYHDTTKYENIWSPNGAWNFLNDFFTFVMDEIHRVKYDSLRNCLWKFSSFENNENNVTCKIFIEENINGENVYQPLPVNYII